MPLIWTSQTGRNFLNKIVRKCFGKRDWAEIVLTCSVKNKNPVKTKTSEKIKNKPLRGKNFLNRKNSFIAVYLIVIENRPKSQAIR